MVKSKQLANYLKKNFSLMDKCLSTFSNTKVQEDLHRFRVSVKKTKALIHLLEFVSDSQKTSDHFKPLKKIYSHSGIIREAHIELLLVKQFSIRNKKYVEQLKKTIKTESELFGNRKQKHSTVLKKVEKDLLSELINLKEKDIQRYVKDQIKQLSDDFLPKNNIKKFHKGRMVLKNLFYNHDFFPKNTKTTLNLNHNYLNKLQDIIGKWHDAAITVNRLSSIIPERNPKLIALKHRERQLFQTTITYTKNFSNKVFLRAHK